MNRTIFILGAGGYIGKTVVREASAAGWTVKGLVRSEDSAASISTLGGIPVMGDVMNTTSWIKEAAGCRMVVDLIQPELPKRLSKSAIRKVAAYRLMVSRAIVSGLKQIAQNDRPPLLNVSGVDDLDPDATGQISHRSALAGKLKGFAHIGVPVRQLLEHSGLPTVYGYLGTVYGPGKAFAAAVIPGIVRHTMPVIGNGSNHIALIHVEDAARAIVHIGENLGEIAPGSTWVICDGTATTQAEFMDGMAALLHAEKPRRIPCWLASLVAGKIMTEVLSRETRCEISALQATGFRLRYPGWQTGVPQMLKALGYSGREQK